MRKRTARSGFKHIKDNDLLSLGGTVHDAMDGNANFPTPEPTLEDVQDALDDYRAKLQAAQRKGSPLDMSLKNDSREVLVGLLKRLAFYVNTVADGSLSLILSSGFPVVALPTPAQPPAMPLRIRLRDHLQSGQIRLDFDPAPGAWLYEYQYSDQVDGMGGIEWPLGVQTTSRGNTNILAPVTPGTKYFVRVRARNAQGESDWTTPESIFAR